MFIPSSIVLAMADLSPPKSHRTSVVSWLSGWTLAIDTTHAGKARPNIGSCATFEWAVARRNVYWQSCLYGLGVTRLATCCPWIGRAPRVARPMGADDKVNFFGSAVKTKVSYPSYGPLTGDLVLRLELSFCPITTFDAVLILQKHCNNHSLVTG